MKTFKYILFLMLILFIGSSIYIAVQPNEYSFSRSRDIKAPAVLLFNKVNNLKKWPQFSPWLEKEPSATLSYGLKTSGPNASYGWEGKTLGKGHITILDTDKNKFIKQQITFKKPFESESRINWFFEPNKTGTKVTWQMEGKQNFMTKMYTTFAGSIESNTSLDFDRGLYKLDSIVTLEMNKHDIKINGITEYGGGFYMYKTTSATSTNIPQIIDKQYEEITNYMLKNNINSTGKRFTIYNEMNPENGNVIMSNAIPIMNKVIVEKDNEVLCGFIPKTKALKATLTGDYKYLPEAWETAKAYISKNKIETSSIKPFEVYMNNPKNIPNPANYITEIFIPIIE